MFQVMPLWGFLFPSPIYHIRQQDAVVTLARRPPEVEYFSFTTFAAWLPGREVPVRSPAPNRSVAHPFLLAAFHSKSIGEQ